MTPERLEIQRAKARLRARAWRAALLHRPAALAAYRARNAERERRRRGTPPSLPGPLAGSVLAAAAPGPGRELLAQVTALAPRGDEREDVIGHAVLLALEGTPIPQAVAEADRQVRRASRLRYASPLEACTWL